MYGRGYQGGGLGFGPPVTPPIIKQLLIANALVFAGQLLTTGSNLSLTALFSVQPYLVWQQGWIWQPFTYMWLHGGLAHILMNLFVLWMFGTQLAMVWGPKRFLRYYLVCGAGAGLIIATAPYLLVGLGIASEISLHIPTLGASGAIYGVLLAYSLTWPDRTIMLLFPPVAFRAIWLIPILFFMTLLFGGGNVSHVGHLGGVLVGWLYLRRSGDAGSLLSLEQLKYRWRRYRMRQRLRAVQHEEWEARKRRDDPRYH
ncbi:MAG: rhomboid family intramembrane serine protease [Myxococcales bacterium]|nr:rhomboid family intramembrane serine protease [Myxococcales bacterium]MDH5306386.1 rhomboid family intramembrane serine protease [Myxococcales bacterium]MDH5566342.1 rhomboid family intramembrane serine protease [Myxococcales bacterium]